MPLTPALIRAALPRDRLYTLSDGGGMVLQVTPQGRKRWRLRYRYRGIPNMISLGLYPEVGLRAAREQGAEARGLLALGFNPSVERRTAVAGEVCTFEAVARDWLQCLTRIVQKRRRSPDVLRRARWVLNNYLLPALGPRPIAEVSAYELLGVLKAIESHGLLDTVRRVRQQTSRILRHAVGLGHIPYDLTAGFRGLLMPPQPRHHPGITNPKRLGVLLRAIDGYQGAEKIAIALKLTPLLFARPGELRRAEWNEIDFERAQWRVPAEHMKMRAPHIVPLCRQALELLERLHSLTGDGRYLFPAYRNPDRTMSGTRLAAALASLGFSSREVTPHGFRSTACTLLNELGWRGDAIERQLAHAVGDSARRLYNHAQYLPERTAMMQAWADYLDELRGSAAQHIALPGAPIATGSEKMAPAQKLGTRRHEMDYCE